MKHLFSCFWLFMMLLPASAQKMDTLFLKQLLESHPKHITLSGAGESLTTLNEKAHSPKLATGNR